MPEEELPSDFDELYSQTYSQLSNVISELNEQQEQLSDFLAYLDEIQSDYEDFDGPEKRDFASAISSKLTNLDRDIDLRELLEYREEIEEAHASPIVHSAQRDIERIFTTTGASEAIESVNDTALQNAIQNTVKSKEENIADIRQVTHQSKQTIEHLPQPALDHISESLTESPGYYTRPENLKQIIDETQRKHNDLIELNDKIETLDWLPEAIDDLHLQKEFYSVKPGSFDRFESKAESIAQRNEHLGSKTELPVTEVVRNELEEKSEELLNDPLSVLESTDEALESITNYADILREIKQIKSSEEEADIIDLYESLVTDTPESLDDVLAELEDLKEKYRDWKDRKYEEALRKQSITKSYLNRFEINDELVQDIVDVQLSSETEGHELANIIRNFEKLIEEEELKEIKQLDERAEDIFRDLVTNGERSLSEEDISCLEEIINIVDIKVTIDESGE